MDSTLVERLQTLIWCLPKLEHIYSKVKVLTFVEFAQNLKTVMYDFLYNILPEFAKNVRVLKKICLKKDKQKKKKEMIGGLKKVN